MTPKTSHTFRAQLPTSFLYGLNLKWHTKFHIQKLTQKWHKFWSHFWHSGWSLFFTRLINFLSSRSSTFDISTHDNFWHLSCGILVWSVKISTFRHFLSLNSLWFKLKMSFFSSESWKCHFFDPLGTQFSMEDLWMWKMSENRTRFKIPVKK